VTSRPIDDREPSPAQARLETEHVNVWELATGRNLHDLAGGPLGDMISATFRVMPRQSRSMRSVEQLLAGCEAIVRRSKRLDTLTMEAVAYEAGVTPQAAYRYFGDVRDLVKLAIRRVQVVEYEHLLTLMTTERFDTEMDLAKTAVAFVVRAYRVLGKIPAQLSTHIARDYCDPCYDALWKVAELTHAAMVRRNDPCSAFDVTQIAAGLTAVAAVAKSLCLRDFALFGNPGMQDVMLGIFLGALHREPRAPSADSHTPHSSPDDRAVCLDMAHHHSHAIVPGGFDVTS